MNLVNFHKWAFYLQKKKLKFLANIIYKIQFLVFNSSVPPTVKIGAGSQFAYGGIGVVIHKNVIIGNNCTIGQGITIGGRSKKLNVPVIGDDVYIGAGVRIIGDIKIGNNVIIGPNSVVIHDIEDNTIVVGIPAKPIKKIKSIYDHI